MAAEIPTKELTTKNGHVLVYKAFLSLNDLEDILDGDLSPIKKTKEMIKKALISVDGSTEKPFEKICEIELTDYTEMAKIVSEMIGGDLKGAK